MSMRLQRRMGNEYDYLGRMGALVVVCTAVLTASFLGLVALGSGVATDVMARVPGYVLVLAATFVAGVVLLEESRADGTTVLVRATAISLVAFVVVSLSVEGTIYALANPDDAFGSQLLFYLLAAGLIGTGLGYWGLRHWRELVARSTRGSL
jgi:hypothetical protein